MRYLFASDIHISESKRLPDTLKSLDYITEACQYNRVETLILLGDIFDRNHPTIREYEAFNKWLVQVKYIVDRVVILEGNHDLDNNISALSYLTTLDVSKVVVLRPPFLYGPFYLGHEHIEGAVADNGHVLSGGKSLTEVINDNPGCKVFAFGDFHTPQVLREQPLCFYAGSITRTRFSEVNDKKYLWLFDDHVLIGKLELPLRPMYVFEYQACNTNGPFPEIPQDQKNAIIKIKLIGSKEEIKSFPIHILKNLYREHDLTVEPIYTKTSKDSTNTHTNLVDLVKDFYKEHKYSSEIIKEFNNVTRELKV